MWQEWERIERGVQDLAPVLRHVDRIEAIARRAERSPFGPLQAVPGVLRKLRRKWPTRGLVAS